MPWEAAQIFGITRCGIEPQFHLIFNSSTNQIPTPGQIEQCDDAFIFKKITKLNVDKETKISSYQLFDAFGFLGVFEW